MEIWLICATFLFSIEIFNIPGIQNLDIRRKITLKGVLPGGILQRSMVTSKKIHTNCRQKEETILRERFEQEAEMATRGNERREAERRWANKVKVHNHRKMKAAEERRRAEELESEVAAMAGRKRERALQDYIRVNIRKVI